MSLVIPLFISHHGCPHQCLFCNQQAIAGADRGDGQSSDDIEKVIAEWLARSPGHRDVQVAFYGGSFTCLAEEEQFRLLQTVQPFIMKGDVHAIRLSTRPDCINRETAEYLRDNHVQTVELGVQSLDDSVLRTSQRGHSAVDSIRAVQILQDSDLKVGVQLLPGLPGESTTSFFRTVHKVISLRPDLVRLYPAVVVRGSALATMFESGLYSPLSLNRAVALVTMAYGKFLAAGIPVVRMGLQPSPSLEENLVAGPYHPAFGELVQSRIWFRKIRKRLARLQKGEVLRMHISNRDHSAIVGMKRANINRFEQLGYRHRFTFVPEKHRERGSINYVVC